LWCCGIKTAFDLRAVFQSLNFIAMVFDRLRMRQEKMTREIERKFLVQGDFRSMAAGKFEIKQGYLSIDPERTVRIRIASKKGFLTIKGPSDASGMSRFEWEQEISLGDAEGLLKLCLPHLIEKTRYVVDYEDHVFEIDEFHGANQGLLLAEVELSSTAEECSLPDWIGKEVTKDPRYYNSYLSNQPFSTWE
jgi:adenylate cyclase